MTRALSRSLPVLELLASSTTPLDLGEIIACCEMPRATAHRLMASLVRDGYVVRDEEGRYRVSLRIWGVAANLMVRLGVREVALPHMVDLASAIQHQVALCVLEGDEACYTERVEVIGGRVTSTLLDVRVPALCVASGRLLAAWRPVEEVEPWLHNVQARTPFTCTDADELRRQLACIREQGYATIDREYDVQASGIAVPIFNAAGEAVAAISIVVWGALTPEAVQRALRPLLAAGRRTSAELGYRTPASAPVA